MPTLSAAGRQGDVTIFDRNITISLRGEPVPHARVRADVAGAIGRLDVEARLAQHDLQRPQDLQLVVADQDAPAGRHGATAGWACFASGKATSKTAPWPGSDSAVTVPPLASTKPLTIA